MKIVDQANTIALMSLQPGPAAFWHRYIWNKIHAVHVAHSNHGLFGSEMAMAPKMIIDEGYNQLPWNQKLIGLK